MYSSVFVILLGLGTVFFGLIVLILLTMLMGRILERNGTETLTSSGTRVTKGAASGGTVKPTQTKTPAAPVQAKVANGAGVGMSKGTGVNLSPSPSPISTGLDGAYIAASAAAIAEQLNVDVSGIKILSFRRL